MKYLFFLIFSLNIIFYIFLIFKPLNIELDFSIKGGNNLSEIFNNLEEKNIYFPKSIKLIFNVSGIDKKIYLGLDLDNSICTDFQNKTKKSNYLFSVGIDWVYELFNFESRINSNILNKSINVIGKNKSINDFFKKFADLGLRI